MKWKWGAVGTASIVLTEKATHSWRNRRSRVQTLYAFQQSMHWTRLTPAANDVMNYQVTINVNGVGIKRRASNAKPLKRKHNPKWKDNTRAERIQKRRQRLNEIAKENGFVSWSAFETAVLNGVASLTLDGAHAPKK